MRSEQTLRTKADIGIRKLAVEIAALRNRDKTTRGRSEVRSPLRGIVAEVRQEVQNGKLHVSMLIRRL
jgi:translation initiation factor IF-2